MCSNFASECARDEGKTFCKTALKCWCFVYLLLACFEAEDDVHPTDNALVLIRSLPAHTGPFRLE